MLGRGVIGFAVLLLSSAAHGGSAMGGDQHRQWVAEELPVAYRAMRECLDEGGGPLRLEWLNPAQEEVWALVKPAGEEGLQVESNVWAAAGGGENVVLVDDDGDGVVNAAGWSGQPLQRGAAVEESEETLMVLHTVIYIATEQERCVAEKMGLGEAGGATGPTP